MEAFFEGESLSPAGAVNSYNNKKIVLRETSSATHSFKHNEADAGAINVADAGSMYVWRRILCYRIGTSDFNNATALQVVNAKDLNNGASGLGLIFTANATTLAGTGRVKPIELSAD